MDRARTSLLTNWGGTPEIPNLPICCKEHALYALKVYGLLRHKSLLNAQTYGDICDRIYEKYPALRQK